MDIAIEMVMRPEGVVGTWEERHGERMFARG